MLISLEEIDNLTVEELDNYYKNNYSKALYKLYKTTNMDAYFNKAEGMYLWDIRGVKYLDFMAGFGALNLGHNPSRVARAIEQHLNKPNLIQQSINVYNGVLGNNISFLTDGKLPVCCFANCGTETVELALELSFIKAKEGCIIYCTNAYHGKTLGAISALGTSKKNKYPNLENKFIEVPFGDAEAFKNIVKSNKAAAFLVEPIQGEGGINLPPEGYFKEVRKICDDNEIILIFDEIQTGLGRCGSMFCYTQFDIIPDILCLSKSLSGGLVPVGCIAVKEELWNATYGKTQNATLPCTTFGGNTLACVAAIETLNTVVDEKLSQRSKEMGEYALKKLAKLKERHKIITDIRGRGLFIGIEFGGLKGLKPNLIGEFMMSTILSKLLNDYKILCGFAANNPTVLKVEPALIVEKDQIDYFAESLDKVLEKENSNIKLALDSIAEIGKNTLELMI